MKRKLEVRLAAAAIALLGLTTIGKIATVRGQTAAKAAPEVKIDNFTFAPQDLTIPAGTSVRWVNRDDIPHTVVSDDKSTFKSKALDTDDSFAYTFTKPGTYSYFCSIHPKMTAKVIVQ
jgi:plastocyanin